MPVIDGNKSAAHLLKGRIDGFGKVVINELKDPVHSIGDVRFCNLISLFEPTLFKFDNELLVH